MHTKRFNTLFKIWMQFRVGAIPRLLLDTSLYFYNASLPEVSSEFFFVYSFLFFLNKKIGLIPTKVEGNFTSN